MQLLLPLHPYTLVCYNISMRKLHRHTRGDRHIVGGVLSGLADWLEIHPGILRAGFIVLLIASGGIPAILLYFAAMFLIKKHPVDHEIN